MSAPAIVVDRVGKQFRRPHEQMHTFKERALHPFRRQTYDVFEAVRDVTFSVDEGEFFGIVGRNGSGKSTLLKLIAGIYKANGGEIWINGRMSTFIELGVGFNPDLAALDNVVLNGIMLGLTPTEARDRYDEVIEFAELKEFEDLKLKNYSSGMHVRLAFSVMVHVDADILLVDEVLAVGDAAFQQKCFDEFNRLRDAGKSIVLVTHDMGAVRRFAHRAMLMERGKVISEGDPDMVGNQYVELNFNRGQQAEEPPPTDRFGNASARILDLWVEDAEGRPVSMVTQGTDLTVHANLEFRDRMEHPVVALTVETAEHQSAFVANSMWVREQTGVYEPGDRATVSVRFRNIFAPGRYLLSPSIASRGGLDLADYRPRMTSFISAGAGVPAGIVNLDYELEVQEGTRSRPLAELA
jgi:ABC-type polysaccharide/polyol phosphate transport system ATPase subunit